jgi:hypothetical protein
MPRRDQEGEAGHLNLKVSSTFASPKIEPAVA